jgi:hypothetical protein
MSTDTVKHTESGTDEVVELGSMTEDTKGPLADHWYDGGVGFFF